MSEIQVCVWGGGGGWGVGVIEDVIFLSYCYLVSPHLLSCPVTIALAVGVHYSVRYVCMCVHIMYWVLCTLDFIGCLTTKHVCLPRDWVYIHI